MTADFGYRRVDPIGKREVYGHVHSESGCSWGPIEIDDYPDSPKGNALRVRRVSAGIGLRDLARATGLTPVQLSDLERGRAVCDWSKIYRVIEQLDPENNR